MGHAVGRRAVGRIQIVTGSELVIVGSYTAQ
jgi:hypothetical protein